MEQSPSAIKPVARDLIFAGGAVFGLLALAATFDLSEMWYGWINEREDSEIDEVPIALALGSIAFGWFSYRQWARAKHELKERIKSNAQLSKAVADLKTAELATEEAYLKLYQLNCDLEDRVDIRTHELNTAKQIAESANHAKSDFLANISHELRTPLNAITGFSEAMRDEMFGPLSKQYKGYAGDINDCGRHLEQLMDEILEFSKSAAGKMAAELQDTKLDELLADIDNAAQPLVAKKKNVLEIENTATLSAFMTDPEKLRQALLHLLDNAAKFTRDGSVRLEVTQTTLGWLNFSVSDSGIGMSADQLNEIFEPFNQGNAKVAKKNGGIGLGLAITNNTANLLGGQLEVESAPGKGSKFTIGLPIRYIDDVDADSLTA